MIDRESLRVLLDVCRVCLPNPLVQNLLTPRGVGDENYEDLF